MKIRDLFKELTTDSVKAQKKKQAQQAKAKGKGKVCKVVTNRDGSQTKTCK